MKTLSARLALFFRHAAQTGRIMVGVGDYAQYIAHMQAHHPQLTPMTRQEHFRYCQQARYPCKPGDGGKISRCPC